MNHHGQTPSQSSESLDQSLDGLATPVIPPTLSGLLDTPRFFSFAGLVTSLASLDKAINTTVDFLVDNIVYRVPDVFEDELMEARAELEPVLGEKIVLELVADSEQARNTSSGVAPSNDFLRSVSRNILVNTLCCSPPDRGTRVYEISKKLLLNKYRSLFKVASWALPTSPLRSVFEELLTQTISASSSASIATDGNASKTTPPSPSTEVVDSLTITDLIFKVRSLNGLVFKAATFLEETLFFSKCELSDEERRERSEFVSCLVSKPHVQLLEREAQKPEATINRFLVQVTARLWLTGFCAARIHDWFSSNRQVTKFLRDLYREIRLHNDQATSSRWRALTHSQLRPNTKEWTKELETESIAVLSVASWNFTTDQRKTFMAKLPAIFEAIEEIKIALNEKFHSADIDVDYVPPGSPFDKTIMQEAYGDEGGTSSDLVFGTTTLGLSRYVLLDKSPKTQTFGKENLLPSKVILDSKLKGALDPGTPQTPRSAEKRKSKRS